MKIYKHIAVALTTVTLFSFGIYRTSQPMKTNCAEISNAITSDVFENSAIGTSQVLSAVDESVMMVSVHTDLNSNERMISEFVVRLYQSAFDRIPDEEGHIYWIEKLRSQEKTGAQIVFDFLNSQEMRNKNLSDLNYLNILYKTLMDRTADSSGINFWLDCLRNGCSKTGVLRQFTLSSEFQNICDDYGIKRGIPVVLENRDQNLFLTMFVNGLYKNVLERSGSVDELNGWIGQILSGNRSVESVCKSFFTSTEFIKKNYSNDQFIIILYRTLLGKDPDSAELSLDRQRFSEGRQRTEIIESLLYSRDFAIKVEDIGLIPSPKPQILTGDTVQKPDGNLISEDEIRDEIIRLLNQYRENNGLQKLSAKNELNQAAKTRSREIINKFDHIRPDGRDVWTAIAEAGYKYNAAGENIAYCGVSSTSKETALYLFNMWKDSPLHNENMMDPIYRDVGVGILIENSKVYGVQMFGNLR